MSANTQRQPSLDELKLFASRFMAPNQKRIPLPFWKDGKITFTDGHILLHLDCPELPAGIECVRYVEGQWQGGREPPKVGSLLALVGDPIQDVPHVDDPPESADDRWCIEYECTKCVLGVKTCDLDHEHECPHCEGTGVISEKCDEAEELISIQGCNFAARYIWYIRQLEDAKLCNVDSGGVLPFVFRDGCGLVMKMHT